MKLFAWEAWHYSLLALAVATGSIGVWASVTGGRGLVNLDLEPRMGKVFLGMFLIVLAVVLAGIFQDMRLDHLCAFHGTCR